MLVALVLAPTSAGAGAPPQLHVVADGLNNPRKLYLAADGALYVVEAGVGGRDRCLGNGPRRTCVGLTGSIARIAGGRLTRAVTGLWSGAAANGRKAQGPADVEVHGRTFYVLLQDSTIDAHGANALGPDGVTAGNLVSTPAGRAQPAVLFNFAVFEAARDPDHGAGPGAKLGDPRIDSDPYAFTRYRGGYAVVDAAGNDLLWVRPGGKVDVLAVFPIQKVAVAPGLRARLGLPAGTAMLAVQSVPTCVAVGPDGALYVGELTGVPFPRGRARIWRVVPGERPRVYASGLTSVADIAFAGRNLLVLELASRGLLDDRSPGALVRIAPGGARRVVIEHGLVHPTGLAVGGGRIYISNYGFSTGSGPGPHGQIVSLPAQAAS